MEMPVGSFIIIRPNSSCRADLGSLPTIATGTLLVRPTLRLGMHDIDPATRAATSGWSWSSLGARKSTLAAFGRPAGELLIGNLQRTRRLRRGQPGPVPQVPVPSHQRWTTAIRTPSGRHVPVSGDREDSGPPRLRKPDLAVRGWRVAVRDDTGTAPTLRTRRSRVTRSSRSRSSPPTVSGSPTSATSSATPTPRRDRPVSTHGRQRGLLPDGVGRQRPPTERRPELLRCPLRPIAALRP